MPTSTSLQIKDILLRASGPTQDAMETAFFSKGSIVMVVDSKSNYVSGGLQNGIVQYGTIYIGTKAVDSLAQAANITPAQAAQAMAIHELGHAYYQQRAYMNAPGDNASIDAKANWCLEREGMASFYAFKVAQESGNHFVAGTTALPNLYDAMLQALNGIDPRSSMYEIMGIAKATEKFKEDPKYVAFCKNPNNWKAPAYITTDFGSSTGVSGGSGAGGFGYVPEPGGYWQIPENSSNSTAIPGIPALNDILATSISSTHPETVSDTTDELFAGREIVTLVGAQQSSYMLHGL